MKILVILRMVPDVIEELEVTPDGKALDSEFLRLIINESDNHALEEALLLKERHGGTVTALALDASEIDEVLFTAVAKGADRAVKITGVERSLTTRKVAAVLAKALPAVPNALPADMILTGCQAIDDLDGQVAPLLTQALDLPYLGLVTKVDANPAGARASVVREFAGGVRGEFEVPMPAVLGIQAAEKPPRYVPVAKVRAVMKSAQIESVAAAGAPEVPAIDILEMKKPEAAGRAQMIEGSPEQAAAKICDILAERGLL
jgi:electron transfer flavoprotein beta subunit